LVVFGTLLLGLIFYYYLQKVLMLIVLEILMLIVIILYVVCKIDLVRRLVLLVRFVLAPELA